MTGVNVNFSNPRINAVPFLETVLKAPNYSLLFFKRSRDSALPSYARFTLADPTPQLASDVVGGKSGQSHPVSRRDSIHIGQMARNAYIRVGWYGEGVLFITTPSERQSHCTRLAPDRPMPS